MTITDLYRIIRKHVVAALVAFGVIVVCVGLYALAVPKHYETTAEVSLSANQKETSDLSTASSYISSQIGTFTQTATTDAVLRPAAVVAVATIVRL